MDSRCWTEVGIETVESTSMAAMIGKGDVVVLEEMGWVVCRGPERCLYRKLKEM